MCEPRKTKRDPSDRPAGGRMLGILALALVAAWPSTGRAGIIPMSGDIRAFLNGIGIPGSDSEAFVEPSPADRTAWRNVIARLVNGDFAGAEVDAAGQGYELIEFTDNASGRVYFILREKLQFLLGPPLRGLGTYVFNTASTRSLNIQSPHPLRDNNTRKIAVEMFVQLNAVFFQLAGTHRCANSAASPCDGTTSTCGGTNAAYPVSDVAHYVNTFYQAASDEVANQLPRVVSVSVHGFTPCGAGCPSSCSPLDTSLVQLGNGTTGSVANSLATRLAGAYNVILDNLPTPYPGLGAASFNLDLAAGEPPELAFAGCPAQPGGTNVQGRSLNGAADPCEDAVADAPLPERFIHLEQQQVLREDPPGSSFPGVNWQITVDAFAATFRETVWVDFAHVGAEAGGFFTPFNTLAEGVAAARPGQAITLKPGSTHETILIDSHVCIRSFGGTATIGN